jgi:diguanylate cyclase
MMKTVASRLQDGAQSGDLIGRYPAGHFVVVRQGLSEDTATTLAAQMVRALSAPVESVEGIPFRVDPVAGVALAPQHGRDLRQLVPRAEAALSDASARRQSAHVYEPEVPSRVDDRLELLRRLTVAVTDPKHASEITMVFQPQVSIATGRTNSVEALLRWHPPERDRVPTDELLQIVEPTGLMQQVTRQVLDRVARQVREWNDAGLRLRAAVNVSPLDLTTDDEFHLLVADTLRRHDISPKQLDIEVTERAMVDDTDVLDSAAHRVARLGVGISLDDFGTGFASLRRLRRFPLTEVKIDRSYVSRIVDSPQDHAMVKCIYDIAQVLELRLVAEGVEDEATVRKLANLGRVIGQGWYYAQPMPPDELAEWLRARGDYTPPG